MSRESILHDALTLSPDERVRLVDDLLKTFVDSDGCAELTPEQQAELLRRLDSDRTDLEAAISWETAESQIRSPK